MIHEIKKKPKLIFFFNLNKGFLSKNFISFAEILVADYDVIVYGEKQKPLFQEKDGLLINMVKNRGKVIGYFHRILFLLKQRPDIIIANFTFVNSSLIARRFFKFTCICWMHTLESQINSARFHIIITRYLMKGASAFIVNSPYLKDDLKTIYQVKQPIYTIPFWTDINLVGGYDIAHNNSSHTIKIGVPGRLHFSKQPELILEALGSLNNKGFRFEVEYAGEGPMLMDLQVKSKQLQNVQVKFLGNLSEIEMKRFYQRNELIVLASKNEAFGLVLIEAMALGRAVFVSNRFGSLSYINDKGYIDSFNPDNPEQLVHLLDNISKENLIKKGKKLKEIYKNTFRKDIILERFRLIINEI